MKFKNAAVEFTNKTIPLQMDPDWNHSVFYIISMFCTELSSALRQLNSENENGFELTLADSSTAFLSIINLGDGQVEIRIDNEPVEQANIQMLVMEFLDDVRCTLDELLSGLGNDAGLNATRHDILEYLSELETCLNICRSDATGFL